MDENDFVRIMGQVAQRLWGEPNPRLSNRKELRFGTRGSRCVDLAKGTWFDHETNEGGGNFDLIKRETGRTGPEAITWLETEGLIEKQTNGSGGGFNVVASYDYHDENNKLLFQVVRFEPKDFRQRRPDGNGGWIWNLGKTRRVLYRLRDLIKVVAEGKPVCLVEGEKDVESCLRVGIPATTSPGGAAKAAPGGRSKWRQEYNEHLRGAAVVLLPDGDEAGQAHMQSVARSLRAVAKEVRVLDLTLHWPDGAGVPNKADVSDWLAAGGTADALRALIAETPPWEPGKDSAAAAERDKHGNIEDETALAFAAKHADHFRFVAIWSRWMFWHDNCWRHEDTLSAFDQARLLCRESGDAKAKTVAAVVTLARADRAIAAREEQWDVSTKNLNMPTNEKDDVEE
jgi:putative DNA primase/helicase